MAANSIRSTLHGLQRLVGYIYPGYYWLDANGYFGYEGGQALGNLIYVAQGVGSSGGGNGYFGSTYFGNVGSDGQSHLTSTIPRLAARSCPTVGSPARVRLDQQRSLHQVMALAL